MLQQESNEVFYVMTQQKDRIYLDNSASTAVDERVLAEMQPYWRERIGNAGSLHAEGQEAKRAVESARKSIATALNTQDRHIIFTSGGTESNNMAVLGAVRRAIDLGREPSDIEVITSKIEHSSVIDCFEALKQTGVRVFYLNNNEEGLIDTEELMATISKKTLLVSLVYVNNEIGTVQDDAAIKHAIREAKKRLNTTNMPLLHYDASQAPVWLHLDVEKLSADFLTLDSQKLYGPKGVGCLYVRSHDTIEQILYGGGQEMGLRPGTPPTPLIVGFAKALAIVEQEREEYVDRCAMLQSWFIETVEKEIEHVTVNGPHPGKRRAVGNINLSFQDIDAERLVIELDAQGIACSTGSACLLEGAGGSHIIRALHKDVSTVTNTVRFTLHRDTTKEDFERVFEILLQTVTRLREEH